VLAGIGEAFIDAIEVVTGLFKDKAVDMVSTTATKELDGQVDPGVYQLSPDELSPLKDRSQKIAKLPAAPGNGPILVLVHGTFVDTWSTFAIQRECALCSSTTAAGSTRLIIRPLAQVRLRTP
jgi:hypothetical protein